MPINLKRLQEDEEDEEVVNDMEQLAVSELEAGKYLPPRYVHRIFQHSKITSPPIFIWDNVRPFAFTL
jgi:hypothetical protein